MKKLEAPDLSLLDTQAVIKDGAKEKKQPRVEAGSSESHGFTLMDTQAFLKDKTKPAVQPSPEPKTSKALPGGGMNPYDNGGLPSAPRPRETFDASKLHPALAHKQPAARKEQSRQSIQTKYHGKTPNKPQGLLDKLKSALRGK